MMRTSILALFALGMAVPPAAAQQSSSLTPGARLRVTLLGPGPRIQVGYLRAMDDSTLTLGTAGSATAIPLASIDHLELSRGRKLSVPGGVAGLLLGAAAGGTLGCLANKDSYGVFCAGQDDTKLIVGAVLGGAAGATLGALLFRRERWVLVSTPR